MNFTIIKYVELYITKKLKHLKIFADILQIFDQSE